MEACGKGPGRSLKECEGRALSPCNQCKTLIAPGARTTCIAFKDAVRDRTTTVDHASVDVSANTTVPAGLCGLAWLHRTKDL
jgi:hypothetical protein